MIKGEVALFMMLPDRWIWFSLWQR